MNSVQEACTKCFAVHILKFEILQKQDRRYSDPKARNGEKIKNLLKKLKFVKKNFLSKFRKFRKIENFR